MYGRRDECFATCRVQTFVFASRIVTENETQRCDVADGQPSHMKQKKVITCLIRHDIFTKNLFLFDQNIYTIKVLRQTKLFSHRKRM